MWTTTFNTADRQIEHKFDNGYQITVDLKFNIAFVRYKDNTTSFSVEEMSIEEYHLILEKYGKY